MNAWAKQKAFTIVELLIVIVVIAILAAITVVAYNGVQQQANVSKSLSELANINKLVQLYYADNGSYPVSTGWSGINKQLNFVPGIVPEYAARIGQTSMPNIPLCYGNSNTIAAYMYRSTSNGSDYKLIAHCDGLCDAVKAQKVSMVDPVRDCWGYGYWTPGASGL